jgi:DNA polymerase II large subunit
MKAYFKCLKCKRKWRAEPGPTKCIYCGNDWVKWLNYKLWHRVQNDEYKNT